MEIKIQPLDTLFFRDGKPFEKGENTWADGMMLPNPTVLYGALRTAFASANNISFKDIFIEDNEDNERKFLSPKDFSIQRIYYYVNDAEVLPLPLDYVEHQKSKNIKETEKDNKFYEVHQLEMNDVKKKVINSKDKRNNYYLLAKNKEQVEEFANGLFDVSQLENYLSNELKSVEVHQLSDYVEPEPKIGISRGNATKVSEDGNLFRVDMQRSNKFQIGVSSKTIYSDFADLIKLGGETKIANLSIDEDSFFGIHRKIEFNNNRFKIYFSSPVILINGEPNLEKIGIVANLITSIIGKPLNIGGFNIVENRPKTMYKVIPAGSVFYYEAENDVSLLNDKQGISLSDKLSEQGFGTCYFGTWNIKE
jgi:CRISPR-associated protein Cmr3